MPRTTARSLSELVHHPEQHTSSGRWHFIADTLNTSPTSYGTLDPSSFEGFSPDRYSIYSSPSGSPGIGFARPAAGSPGYVSSTASPGGTRRHSAAREAPRPGPHTAIKDIQPRFSVPRLETYEYIRRELAINLDKLTAKRSLRHYLEVGNTPVASPAREARQFALSSGQITPGPLFYGSLGTGGLGGTRWGDSWEDSARRTPNAKVEKLIRKMSARCGSCGALGHRWHLPHCAVSTDGTAMSVGFVKAYKTR